MVRDSPKIALAQVENDLLERDVTLLLEGFVFLRVPLKSHMVQYASFVCTFQDRR